MTHTIQHYSSCTAKYPEKPENEEHIYTIDIGEGETVLQCVDCGAFVVVESYGLGYGSVGESLEKNGGS